MPSNAYNVGRDATLVLVVNGAPLAPKGITSFDWKQEVIELKSRPLNGRPIHQNIPDGYSGTFTIDRSDSVLDDFIASQDDAYYAGQNMFDCFIQQTIKDPNTGALSQYRFEGVTLKMADGGSYKQDGKVEMKLDFMATARRKVL